MTKSIVITGVSSGIGYATAAQLVGYGYNVYGSVRQQADGDRVQSELGQRFTPLLFDVTDHAGVETAVSLVQSRLNGQNLAGLVNNAGISTLGPLMHMPLADFRYQFEVNLFGLLDVTQQFLPLLGARPNAPEPRGRIVNVSSVSGQIAYPFFGAYAASKHALEGLSDALRRELILYGIDVVVVEPGTTSTPIIEKASEGAGQYAATPYGEIIAQMQAGSVAERRESAIPVEKVSDVIVKALEMEHPKTRYAIPRKKLSGWLVPRWLPDRWLDRVVASKLGLHRQD
ncbi:MAG: SDR family oxidoreductase [Chloroflexi bacterium]|nr:SDR family oxidoreductase [Chloroflexota bacterium]